jgi:hypothetical protein
LFSLTSPMGYAPDYFQYIYYIEQVTNNGFDYVLGTRFEFGFGLLVYVITFFSISSHLAYSLLVGISSFIKIYVISLHSEGVAYILAVLLFLFKYFLLQDYNQLRAAFSMGFALLYFSYLGKNFYKQMLCIILAISFHYSSLLVLPLIYLCQFKYTRIQIFSIAVAIYLLIKLTSVYIISEFNSLIRVLGEYEQTGMDSAANMAFSPVFFPEFIALISLLVLWRHANKITKNIVTLQIFGFALFYGFIDLIVFAVRSREFISIFWLIFVAQYAVSKNSIKYVQLLFTLLSLFLGLYLFYFSNYMNNDLRWVN